MERIEVIYGKNRQPLGYLIRFFTWSRWQHIGIVVGDMVIEATIDRGVIETPLSVFKKRYRKTHTGYIPCKSCSEALSLARQELGKPYDFRAIFGLVFRRSWESRTRWFCSELVAHTTQIFREDRVSRVTPEHCFKLTQDS